MQRYRGQPVLTWWQGQSHTGAGHGEGVDYIVDRSYRLIATVNAGDGLLADTHEFRLTPEGTALILVYHAVPYDLSAVGGPAAGSVFDGIVQEIDIATGAVLFEWHSLDHVGLDESHAPVPAAATTTYDYFHINAVSVDEDGDLHRRRAQHLGVLQGAPPQRPHHLAAGRHQERLRARRQRGVRLAARPRGGRSRDAAPVRQRGGAGRAAALARDLAAPRSARQHRDPDPLVRAPRRAVGGLAGQRAGARATATPSSAGARPGASRSSIRRATCSSTRPCRPATTPIAPSATSGTAARRPADRDRGAQRRRHDTVHAIWNGATEVARWIVVGGRHARRLRRSASADWNGLDTADHPEHRRPPRRGRGRRRPWPTIGRSASTQVTH